MKRIALCGIGSENCTFSPDRLSRDDFTIYQAADLDDRYAFAKDQAYADLECVNLMMARALPGGPIKRDTFDELVALITEQLTSQGPWDAVYLDLHGAMFVEGLRDAENVFVERVIQVVGNDCLLGASFDLHGNLTESLTQKLVALSAYRTAPHEDEPETRARAFRLLIDALHRASNGEDPMCLSWRRIPVLLPGECTSTQYDPGKSLYGDLPRIQDECGLVDLSLFVGYAWADEPRSSACVVATGTNIEMCEKATAIVAADFWDARDQFSFGMEALSFRAALAAALARREQVETGGAVVISDSGDNPTAGGVGNLVVVLRETLDVLQVAGDLESLKIDTAKILISGIWDRHATDACFEAGEGARLEIVAGTGMDAAYGEPVSLSVTVERLFEGDPHSFRQAVVRCNRFASLQVVFTESRKPFHRRDDFIQLGIVPEEVDIHIVKIGYLVPELFALANHHWLALTPGAVDQNLVRLPYSAVNRPMYPLDRDFDWQSTGS